MIDTGFAAGTVPEDVIAAVAYEARQAYVDELTALRADLEGVRREVRALRDERARLDQLRQETALLA